MTSEARAKECASICRNGARVIEADGYGYVWGVRLKCLVDDAIFALCDIYVYGLPYLRWKV